MAHVSPEISDTPARRHLSSSFSFSSSYSLGFRWEVGAASEPAKCWPLFLVPGGGATPTRAPYWRQDLGRRRPLRCPARLCGRSRPRLRSKSGRKQNGSGPHARVEGEERQRRARLPHLHDRWQLESRKEKSRAHSLARPIVASALERRESQKLPRIPPYGEQIIVRRARASSVPSCNLSCTSLAQVAQLEIEIWRSRKWALASRVAGRARARARARARRTTVALLK